MKQRNHDSSNSPRVEILVIDQTLLAHSLFELLNDFPNLEVIGPFSSDSLAISRLRNSTDNVVLVKTAISTEIKTNFGLLDEIDRLNDQEIYPRVASVFLLADDHTEAQIEEYEQKSARVVLADARPEVDRIIRHTIWRLRSGVEHLPRFELVYGSETLRVFLVGALGRADMCLADGPLEIMDYSANTEQSVTLATMANSLDRSRATVKEYVYRLQRRFDQIRTSVGIRLPGRSVFTLDKVGTSWLYRLRAIIRKRPL